MHTLPRVIALALTLTATASGGAVTAAAAAERPPTVVTAESAPSTAATTVVRANVGGAAYTDTAGRTWAACTGASGGRHTTAAAAPVAGTSDDVLYQQLHLGMSAYRVAVPAQGTYRVTLHMQENYHDAVGERVFSVTAEGSTAVARDLDLVKAVGARTAYTVATDVVVTDGALDLTFTARVDQATLSAVEAVLVSSSGTPAPVPGVRFPIRASADGRSLLDADGDAFSYLADTAWLAPSRLNQADIRTLLDKRRDQGFTAIQMSVLPFLHLGHKTNAYGDLPFVNGTDLARPLEVGARTGDAASADYDYWDHVAWIVQQAKDRGMAVTLVPSWYGYGGEDWRSYVTTSNASTYGTFLGRRLGGYENVVWMLGGDNNPDTGDVARVPSGRDRSDKTAATNAMGNAIRAAEPVRHLMTYHAKRQVSSFQYFSGQPWHTLASAYSDEYTYKHVAASTGRGLPVVMTEAFYDARTGSPVLDHRRLRAEAWWSVLGGAGYAYGHENVWDLDSAWKTGIADTSATDATRISQHLAGLGPITPRSVVLTSGAGSSTGLDRAVTGVSDRTAVTYLPSNRAATVNLAALGGTRVTLTWVDPASGARIAIGTFNASGTKALSWPGWQDALLFMTSS